MNTLKVIQFIMKGRNDSSLNENDNLSNNFRCLITDSRLHSLLTGWYITEDLYPEEDVSEKGRVQIFLTYK